DFESYEPQSANAQLFSTQPKISEDSKTITTQTLKKDREIISKLDKATGEITQEVKFLPAPPTPAQSAEQIKLKITPQNVESEEVTRQSALKNILKSAKNYYFSPREEVKSPKLRLENNLNALKLLKEIHENPRALSEQDKEILNSYSGFGGLTNAFKEGSKELERLQALLNADEIKELKKTILDAYYTPTEIIDTIYKGLKDFLPQDAKVLEPSMGSGRFLGLGNKNYEYAGIEIDPLTFKIAQLLYPQSNIANANYLKMNLINDQFDLVIGNPPYGSLKVDYNQNYGLNIHNAFMLKNIDLAKENGIIAQVITTSFLDSFDSRTRRKVLEKARIIGTMRLSSDTFSGTNIATDIVILQKRPRSEWLDMTNPKQELSEIEARFLGVNQPIGDGFYENNLIKDAPRLSFSLPFMKATGEYTITRGEGGRERLGYEAISKERVNELLSEFSTRLKKYLKDFKTPKQSNDIQNLEELAQRQYTFGAYKVGEISFENGEVKKSFIADDGALETKSISLDELVFKDKVDEYKALASSSNLKPSDKAKLTKFNTQLKIAQTALPKITELKEVATKLNIMELEPNANQQELGILRAKLNNVYDSLMRELKPMMKTPSLNDKRLLNIFEGDVSYSSLSGLEKGVFDEEGELIGITKSDIFSKRVNNPTFTPLHADSPAQALEYSINYKGGVDYGYMAKLLNRDSHEVRQELLRENKVFLFDGQDVLEDTLLSGNIREKKAILQKALEYEYKGGTQEALYQKSLDKILENMPKDLQYSEIKYSMGSSFLPDEVFEGFFQRVYRDENGRFFSTAYTNNYAPYSSEYRVSDADVFNQATGYATRRFKDKHYSVSFDLAVKQLQKDFSEHIAQN
ncbi:hypothetical protein CQA49_09700, partial [Helicobacter sp. MIT 00-7814]|uniref:N-6 DNA methylase n=1 Tax=unclassified Helicobacter TaxID=2593540 RepID=UPI000E398B29